MSARLNAKTLGQAASGVARPAYDFQALGAGIVHLGLGAFHRAHQAVFTEDAIAAAGGDWGIVGVSLQHADAPAALNPQDGLYTVETLADPLGYRVVGALRQALAAQSEGHAVLAAMSAAAIHIVSLTVTEKGYRLGAGGKLDLDHPDIAHDLARPDRPRSAVGWLTEGLTRRRDAAGAPVTVISCDNLMGNGAKLEGAVHTLAERWDPKLAAWIETHARFPQTMVDSIVPAASDQSRARIDAALGLADAASVSREAFAQWVIEDRFAGPRPAWERVGVELVVDVGRYERLKLHVLNASHSALAYLGLKHGRALVREAIADPALCRFADGLVAEEIAPALPDLPVADYWRGARARFANPMLDHRLAQIGEDGSVKLAQRIFPLLIANARAGRPTARLSAVIHAWLELAGEGIVRDPQGARLAAWAGSGANPCEILRDRALFPDAFRTDAAVRKAFVGGRS